MESCQFQFRHPYSTKTACNRQPIFPPSHCRNRKGFCQFTSGSNHFLGVVVCIGKCNHCSDLFVVSAGRPLWWKFFALLFVTVETGSGDRQPYKSASSLVNPIASSSECRCTGFSVSSFLFHIHICQFVMATLTKLNRCSAKWTSWCIGNHLTSCSQPRFCAWSWMSSSRMLKNRK